MFVHQPANHVSILAVQGEEEVRLLSGDVHRLLRASASTGGAPARRSMALRAKGDVAWLMRTTWVVPGNRISVRRVYKPAGVVQGGGNVRVRPVCVSGFD